RRVRAERDRILLTGQIDAIDEALTERALAFLGEAYDAEVVQAEIVGRGERHGELPATAVHDEQVGQIPDGLRGAGALRSAFGVRPRRAARCGGLGAFLGVAPAAETPREHLVDRGVVVAGSAPADVVRAVALLVGDAVLERDHGAHGVDAAEVGNVDALDAPRKRRQAQARLDAQQTLLDVVLGATLFTERMPRVLDGELDQPATRPTRRREDFDAPGALAARAGRRLSALREPLDDPLDAFGQHRDEHFVRNQTLGAATVPVVLAQEARDHLVVRHLDAAVGDAPDVDDAPGAHHHERELDEIPLAIEAEHVLVAVAHRDDALRLPHALHRGELIAIRRGELELEARARLPHPRLELARELVVAAGEEERDGADLRRVLLAIDVVDARRRAALDLVLEAGALAARELPIA